MSGFDPSTVGNYDDLMLYVVKTSGGYACCCGSFRHQWKMNVQNHVESIHFPGHFKWNCEVCGEEAKTRNILAKHKSKFHPKNPSAANFSLYWLNLDLSIQIAKRLNSIFWARPNSWVDMLCRIWPLTCDLLWRPSPICGSNRGWLSVLLWWIQPPMEDERAKPPRKYSFSRTFSLELRHLWGASQD